jgi:hypothetical protein
MKLEITVFTEINYKYKEHIIFGNESTLQNIKNELAGNKFDIQEYLTKSGKIIIDTDIIGLGEIKIHKGRFEA